MNSCTGVGFKDKPNVDETSKVPKSVREEHRSISGRVPTSIIFWIYRDLLAWILMQQNSSSKNRWTVIISGKKTRATIPTCATESTWEWSHSYRVYCCYHAMVWTISELWGKKWRQQLHKRELWRKSGLRSVCRELKERRKGKVICNTRKAQWKLQSFSQPLWKHFVRVEEGSQHPPLCLPSYRLEH